ncbi:hypothetical protein K388_07322 [Streptomyces sp. KhCrAH-43]|uniref:hypothetical protein n=1 Tax=unclassified Streptomyces TaxID=2593676 RepID=UPI000362D5A4|nr:MULTISPECIES: hypothetical protein [unclassified Streptomyces]MYS32950.1 hypothetical protein [Streptomyces sp. SID4920]MYX64505.1 hypothetical protein [Streptomyces sp. SID8373]RAJ45708.1 hypothetical protein K388_07322 [Streptomyces sp. KhCrAH-43]
MSTTLGRQAAATLAIGDRYMYSHFGEQVEVTVSWVDENVDGSFTVRFQRNDPPQCERYEASDVVLVTHRAPRCCPHGFQWADCDRDDECEWPAAIEAAYFGDL